MFDRTIFWSKAGVEWKIWDINTLYHLESIPRECQITEAEQYIEAGIDPCQEKDGHILT